LIAAIWSAARYEFVYRSLIDSFPPQFQDDLTSRYAFPVYALSPSTPLSLQANYVKSLWAGCLSLFFCALAFFSAGNVVFGCFVMAGLSWTIFGATKSWKTYRENRDRVANENDGGM
jgi:hypothetical protein